MLPINMKWKVLGVKSILKVSSLGCFNVLTIYVK